MPDSTPDYEKLIAEACEFVRNPSAYVQFVHGKCAYALEALQGEVTRLRTQRAALIKAWDAWYDGPETRVPNDIVEAMVALKEAE